MFWRKKHQDLDRELQSDLDLEAEEQRATGLESDDARHAARRALGNISSLKAQTREAWGGLWLEWLLADTKYGLRGLLRNPVFTLVSVLSLALGVGVTAGVFGIFDAVFLHAVSARHLEQLRHLEPGDSQV